MALILPALGIVPEIHESSWVAENATITGDVVIGSDCTIWFQTVIRGDCNKIRIGNRVNVQDGSVVHGTRGRGDTILGNSVSIGHRAIIHGCVIHDDVLIGMGATVLDDTVIESNVIVGAGALVTQNQVLESGYLYAGVPARRMKKLDEEMIRMYIHGTAQNYVDHKEDYRR